MSLRALVIGAAALGADTAQAAGPAPASESGDSEGPPVIIVTIPAARHEFPDYIMERMRTAILIKTGLLPDPATEAEAAAEDAAAPDHH